MAEHQRIAAPAAMPNALRDKMRRYRASRCTLDAFAGRSGFRDRFLVYAGRAPLKWYPHQELHLEPRPLEAAYAMLLHLAGVETGSSGWFRTNTAALTERHPTVRSPRILKWWTRTVTLRLLLGAALKRDSASSCGAEH